MKTNLKCSFLIAFTLLCGFLQAQETFRLPEPITVQNNQINVGVFPQVELISIVQTIGNYPNILGFLMTKDSSEYKTDVLNHFKHSRNHPVVKMFDRLSSQPRMLNFSAPSNIMLFTDNSLELRTDIEMDNFVISRAGGVDSLQQFLDLLRDFAIQSSFNKFYVEHRQYYHEIIDKTAENIGSTNFIDEMENFYGIRQKSYDVVLVSLYNFVGFGNSLLCFDGRREIYNTMGPKSVENNLPFFGDETYLKYMIRHEFSHPFVNPLTEKHWDLVKDYASKFESIPENARKNVCGDWQECINEFTIRAITTQLAFNESETCGKQYYSKEKSRGVSYLDSLLATIKYYQQNRNIYPDLDSFYPEVLAVFKEY